MAKFTVYFKDKPIQAKIFDTGVIHIGRDETNELVVDSLAVAPVHAVVSINERGCVIKELNNEFPLLINGVHVQEFALQNNDQIEVGKHLIIYNVTESSFNSVKRDEEVDELNEKLNETAKNNAFASLQIMSGPYIGRILSLRKPMTRMGSDGAGIVIISHRKDGYFISALEKNPALTLNNKPLGDETMQLKDNDVIVVDQVQMQFFYG